MIGLPSLAVMDRSAETRIWLATAPADMRCGFDRLAELASPPHLHQLNQRRRRRYGAAAAKLDEFGHLDPPIS